MTKPKTKARAKKERPLRVEWHSQVKAPFGEWGTYDMHKSAGESLRYVQMRGDGSRNSWRAVRVEIYAVSAPSKRSKK